MRMRPAVPSPEAYDRGGPMSRPSPVESVTRGALFATLSLAGLLQFAIARAALRSDPTLGAADALTAAAKEARKDDGQKKVVLATEPPKSGRSSSVIEVGYASCDDRELTGPPGPKRRFLEGWDFGVVAGGVTTGGSMLAPGADFGLRGGYALTPLTHADLSLTYGRRGFGPASGSDGAFVSAYEISADLSIRYAIAHSGRPIGFSPLLGVQVSGLGWDYRHPILADDGSGTRLVHDDMLACYAPYAGFAARLIDSPRMRLDWVIKAGARFYDASSSEGFRNDSFPATGFVRVQLETHIPF